MATTGDQPTGAAAQPWRVVLQVASRLAPPAALLVAAFFLVYLGGVLPLSRPSTYLAYVAFGVGTATALVFRRGRALFALVTLFLAYVAQQVWLQGGLLTPTARAVYLALVIFAPLNLALLAWLPERGTINREGARRLSVIALEAVIVGLIVVAGGGAFFDWTSGSFLPFGIGRLPHAGVLVVIAAVIAALVGAFRWRSAVSAACAGAIVAFVVAAHVPAAFYTASIFVLAGACMLTIAILHDSFRVAFRDPLTGLPNRHALDERLEALPRRYALAMVDIDRFRDFNAAQGSELGDHALGMMAARIRLGVGRGNVYRYGGEEFAVVLPRLSAAAALPRLDALRDNVASYQLALRSAERARTARRNRRSGGWKGSDTVSLTVSIGVADNQGGLDTPSAVLEEAQRALARAKEQGRNKVSQ